MKNHLYFNEVSQELKELPVTEPNCYYLGKFTERQEDLINKYLSSNHVSFDWLSSQVMYKKFR